jgi:hypothetical protein
MKTTAISALAALLVASSALADGPPPAAAAAASQPEASAKPVEKKPRGDKRAGADGAPKPAPKPGEAAKKEPPCEPVKPCPIE